MYQVRIFGGYSTVVENQGNSVTQHSARERYVIPQFT